MAEYGPVFISQWKHCPRKSVFVLSRVEAANSVAEELHADEPSRFLFRDALERTSGYRYELLARDCDCDCNCDSAGKLGESGGTGLRKT